MGESAASRYWLRVHPSFKGRATFFDCFFFLTAIFSVAAAGVVSDSA